MLDEVDIANSDIYLSNMAKSFPDKAWFVGYVDPDVNVVVDFGGGSGEFCEYVKAKLERSGRTVDFVVIDNNEAFAAAARSRGFRTYSSLDEMLSSGDIDLSRSLLIMSSVIHEVYSYAESPADISGFWRDIGRCGFRQIAIRDMSLNYKNFVNVPAKDVRKLRAMARRPVSLQAKVGDEDDACIADFVPDTASVDPSKAAEENLRHEQLIAVLDTLTARERQVLDYRFGLTDGNERTLEDVGRIFNVTRERVRQIESKALRMLRHPSRMRRLRDLRPKIA